MSRTFALKASALSAYSGSSRSRCPYSFIVEPQPAALTTTLSRFRSSKVSMVWRAKSRDSSSRPAWVESAPQQPCLGATTSQPSAARTRTVAALTGEKKTRCTQPVRVGEELEDHLAESLVVSPALVAALDLLARGLDELVVLHPRRTGRDAGHAPEAEVPVANHLVVHRLLVEALVHQVDAPARRVHLLSEEHVRRARRQAEATVHALVYVGLLRRMVVVEGRERVAAALGPVLAHGVVQGICGGREGALPHVLRTTGADGPRHSVLARRPLVAPALRGVRRSVAVVACFAPTVSLRH